MANRSAGTSGGFTAPHPGSKAMPRWNTAELPDAPMFTWKNWASLIGPGLVMAGSAIGGGEWLAGPTVTARFGGMLLWVATLSILSQVIYNIEISRYTLYTGEPILTGKFRTPPHPAFWLLTYIVLDIGAVFPYLAASAATPLAAVILQRMPDPETSTTTQFLGFSLTDSQILSYLGYAIFLGALVPLVFGGKIYNSLKVVMTFKIAVVGGFLLILAFGYSTRDTWIEIFSGFLKFGNVPIERGEDLNGNGKLDPDEDWDKDGNLDVVEERYKPDVENKEGKLTGWSDRDGDGKPDKFHDVDKDGFRDGDNVDNVFLSLFQGRGLPAVNLAVVALLCTVVAISGNGGLTNTPISNYTRDQGWGMGSHVGAIPSVVGGHQFSLSHVGTVFDPTPEAMPRWKRWYKHIARDQLAVWMPACFIGLGLPSMLSVQFLRRGTEANGWTAAGMTAGAVGDHVGSVSGATMGSLFWFMTMFCGFLVLAPSMVTTADGVTRRWVDVFWTAAPMLRKMDSKHVGKIYFGLLMGYAVFGMFILTFVPQGKLLEITSVIYNYAFAFSCWHTLVINCTLLPKPVRPGWFVRAAMFSSGAFMFVVALLTTYTKLVEFGYM